MKRQVYSASEAKLKRAYYDVRSCIYDIWTNDEVGEFRNSFFDPKLLCNIELKEYFNNLVDNNGRPTGSFSDQIFRKRFDLFEDGVTTYIEESNYSDEIKEAMFDYFYNLTQIDYNRNLSLNREDKVAKTWYKMIADGIRPSSRQFDMVIGEDWKRWKQW